MIVVAFKTVKGQVVGLIGVEEDIHGGLLVICFPLQRGQDPSRHVLPPKDNTARFLPLFQLQRNSAQILPFNASTLLVRSLLEGKGERMEQLVQGLFPFRIRSQDIFSQNLENITFFVNLKQGKRPSRLG